MDPHTPTYRVRISKIGGRYLLFDIKDVVHIRKHYSMCCILTGITPQAPNQNLFSSLPLELKPEEAKLLADQGAAYVEDDTAAHLAQLRDPVARRAYADALRKQRQQIQAVQQAEFAEKQKRNAEAREKHMAKKNEKKKKKKMQADPQATSTAGDEQSIPAPIVEPVGTNDDTSSLFESEPQAKIQQPVAHAHFTDPQLPKLPLFTPTSSTGFLTQTDTHQHNIIPDNTPLAPLQAYLNGKGLYMTPGLRFGGHFSVYPGDPFRYHAHFMATSYGWDEEIDMLDLVGGGRLATGVKKGFVIGGEDPAVADEKGDVGGVRTFTLEWAGM